jgi:hypothetical protein
MTGLGSVSFPAFYDLLVNYPDFPRTPLPSRRPTVAPTTGPTAPTLQPSPRPTRSPTLAPTLGPTAGPSSGSAAHASASVDEQTNNIIIGVVVGFLGLICLLGCGFYVGKEWREDEYAATVREVGTPDPGAGPVFVPGSAARAPTARVGSPVAGPMSPVAGGGKVAASKRQAQQEQEQLRQRQQQYGAEPSAAVRQHLITTLAENLTDKIQRELEMNALGAATRTNLRSGGRPMGTQSDRVLDATTQASMASATNDAQRRGDRSNLNTVAYHQPRGVPDGNMNSSFEDLTANDSNAILNTESIDFDESEVGKLNLAYSFIPGQAVDDDGNTVYTKDQEAQK